MDINLKSSDWIDPLQMVVQLHFCYKMLFIFANDTLPENKGSFATIF